MGQLIVVAVFGNSTIFQYHNPVGHAHGREAVGNDNGNAIAGQLAEVLENREKTATWR